MPLNAVDFTPGGPIKAVDLNQFYNLFTGVMTDQPVTFANTLQVGGSHAVGSAPFRVGGVAAQTANLAEFRTLNADANPIFTIDKVGKISWGPGGGAAVDTSLARSNVGVLTLTGALIATLTTPGIADFTNAVHAHDSTAHGGAIAYGGISGTPTFTTIAGYPGATGSGTLVMSNGPTFVNGINLGTNVFINNTAGYMVLNSLGDLYLRSAATIRVDTGSLLVSIGATFNGTNTFGGATSMSAALTLTGGLVMNSNMTGTGAININGNIVTASAIQFNGAIVVPGGNLVASGGVLVGTDLLLSINSTVYRIALKQ